LARFGLVVVALAVQLFLLPEAWPGLPVSSTAFPLPLSVHLAAARLLSQISADLLLQTLTFSQPFIPHLIGFQ
jgi:hypothetical protein